MSNDSVLSDMIPLDLEAFKVFKGFEKLTFGAR